VEHCQQKHEITFYIVYVDAFSDWTTYKQYAHVENYIRLIKKPQYSAYLSELALECGY